MDRQRLNLDASTCTRTLTGGFLTEVVRLDGTREGPSDADRQRFVESFPIRTI
jgi:hypothetical protein